VFYAAVVNVDSLQAVTYYCACRVIKLGRVRWVGHVASMVEMRNTCKMSVGKPEGMKDHLGDLGMYGRIILTWILNRV
jgi:hypothetical protein